ncbi:MAG TPA: M57 family metalloprotease [Blastocatellia bacterium]|jgi:hypothetical protein|nr:M57 family metalloprotease [Blastocatellia bacterium]
MYCWLSKSLWLVIIILFADLIVTQADCPATASAKWQKGKAAYYSISSNVNDEQKAQIERGLSDWDSANQGNGSDVKFRPADASHPANMTIQMGALAAGNPAKTISAGSPITSASITINPDSTYSNGVKVFDPTKPGYDTIFEKVILHEVGHTMGLDHPPYVQGTSCGSQTAGDTVMNNPCGANEAPIFNQPSIMPTGVSDCDNQTISTLYGAHGGPGEGFPCVTGEYNEIDGIRCYSPIIIDTAGNGVDLTDSNAGVNFNLDLTGSAERIAWTIPAPDDAWLSLDRNRNGVIEDGSELFGNFTPQPSSSEPNGFIALAEFDKAESGGNGDGEINGSDSVFLSLRLWKDINHNGASEPGELFTLPSHGIVTIDLNYRESRRRDHHGNEFRYRAKVRDSRGAQVGRWAYDVFLLRGH